MSDTTIKELEKCAQKLKGNAMFNLSLSDKELFHSNFLGYLFKKYPDLFGGITGKRVSVSEVEREKNNIDLTLYSGKDGKDKYLIENKVKSIARKEQLDKYTAANPNCAGYFLFSLLGNNRELTDARECDQWTEIGYKEIARVLRGYTAYRDYDDKLVSGYADFTDTLITMMHLVFEKSASYNFWASRTLDKKTVLNPVYPFFEKLHLHDVFGKYGSELFASKARDYFKDGQLEIETYYGKGGAGISFLYTLNIGGNIGTVKQGIQIENAKYRKRVSRPLNGKDKPLKDFTEKDCGFFEEYGWFDPVWRSPSGKKYLIYKNDKCFYQYSVLTDEELEFSALFAKIKKDLDFTRKHKP